MPPIPILAPNPILPLVDLPSDTTNSKTTSFIPVIADLHPLEPIPRYQPPLLIRRKPRLFTKRANKPIKNSHTCHKPVREFIPNSVCPSVFPKHICEVKYSPKFSVKQNCLISKPSLFMVSYNTFRIAYSYGGNTGYSRENAYMEAARCLRFFLAREIQILDKSMGIDVTIDDLCDFIDLDDDITESTDNTNTMQHQQPIINIINSNVTIGNNNRYSSDNIVYGDDNNNDYDFIFEEPEGTFGVPSAGSHDDDIANDINLDFDDIIEI
jgi:hypothetical protein